MLHSRQTPREEPPQSLVPDPIIARDDRSDDPEREALLADSVGLAMLVVLEMPSRAERLAFVLHASPGSTWALATAESQSQLGGGVRDGSSACRT